MNYRPTPAQLSAELKRTRSHKQFSGTLRGIAFSLLIVAIAALLLCWFFPVIRISSVSMQDTLHKGDIVVTLRQTDVQRGDLIVFHYGEKLLVKRVIAAGGDQVNILENGTVEVNGTPLRESYVTRPSLEPCTLDFPFSVPQDQLFVLGDCRADSLDSRSEKMGTVAAEQVLGKVLLRLWPPENITLFK